MKKGGKGYNSIPITLVGQHFIKCFFKVRDSNVHEESGCY
jgi:hypothetical protein